MGTWEGVYIISWTVRRDEMGKHDTFKRRWTRGTAAQVGEGSNEVDQRPCALFVSFFCCMCDGHDRQSMVRKLGSGVNAP